ncbi:MAG TPA: PPOX class F420-dependent oxidoreductase [Jatrophihabitantaceae bacterium]|jgi:PPOX class probable F420-dependent enzyme
MEAASARSVDDGGRSVPSTPLPQKVLEFLARPNPAVMATVAKDGAPVSVATWYLLEDDGTILLGLDAKRARLNHLKRDPRVSLTALADDWYTHVSVRGRVKSIEDDEGLRDIDRLATHYTGQAYRNRERPRVSVHVEIESWHGWQGGSPLDADAL